MFSRINVVLFMFMFIFALVAPATAAPTMLMGRAYHSADGAAVAMNREITPDVVLERGAPILTPKGREFVQEKRDRKARFQDRMAKRALLDETVQQRDSEHIEQRDVTIRGWEYVAV